MQSIECTTSLLTGLFASGRVDPFDGEQRTKAVGLADQLGQRLAMVSSGNTPTDVFVFVESEDTQSWSWRRLSKDGELVGRAHAVFASSEDAVKNAMRNGYQPGVHQVKKPEAVA